MWNQEQYDQLTQKIFDKFSVIIDPKNPYSWVKIMELCIENEVWGNHLPNPEIAGFDYFVAGNLKGSVPYAEHGNDKSLAERVARMLGLLDIKHKTMLERL
jgi:hypothetical protein